MRDDKEGMKKQARSNKQQGRATCVHYTVLYIYMWNVRGDGSRYIAQRNVDCVDVNCH